MSTFLRPIDHNDLTTGVSLSDEVYARIGAAIVDGSLAPGERLRDGDIAAQLGISRTPVREALQRLERFGLVELLQGIGRGGVAGPEHHMREVPVHLRGRAAQAIAEAGADQILRRKCRNTDVDEDAPRGMGAACR